MASCHRSGDVETSLRFGKLASPAAPSTSTTIARRWRRRDGPGTYCGRRQSPGEHESAGHREPSLCASPSPTCPVRLTGECGKTGTASRPSRTSCGSAKFCYLFMRTQFEHPFGPLMRSRSRRRWGLKDPMGRPSHGHPRIAPTQVQLVDLLQLASDRPPLDVGPRRLAVMLSAWDKVRDEGLTPDRLPGIQAVRS